jgi:ADP-heptose:LPS heptosyltransferase/predicted SAM-dependent methyltransferase
VSALDPDRLVGEEARKAHPARVRNGFIERYLSGSTILDIGYRGYRNDSVPIVPEAIGVEFDYPGYDGITLPFEEGSQDAVFASHCLEHIEDFQHSIRDWFRVLRIGGHLVVIVPHKFLYEKQTDLPSRYNVDHKRFYTPASLMAEIEMSLRPNTYRLRHLVDNDAHFDYAIPPDRHSGGSYEIELVIEKIRPPAWHLAKPQASRGEERSHSTLQPRTVSEGYPNQAGHIVGPAHGGNPSVKVNATGQGDVAIYDFGARPPSNPRILVLKLDHLGDFIIGLPSLQRLRDVFPTAHIRLVVGSWNRSEAEASHLVDEVIGYDYFPQNSQGWDGAPHERIEKFRALTSGRYDIAIDLRVDEDTRGLLIEVDAAIRCGIGSGSRHPFLDVALPPEHAVRDNFRAANSTLGLIEPGRFQSRMPFKHAFFHETDFRPVQGHLVFGPYITLPVGHFKAVFDLQLTGWKLGLNRTRVTLDLARDGSEIVALKRLRATELKTLDGIELSFLNEDEAARYEFRIHIVGRPFRASLRFAGVRLDHREAILPARYRRAELHIGEQLSLLVQLVSDRARALYDTAPLALTLRDPLGGPRGASAGTRQITIAPFSNSDLRDWPFAHYVKLVRLLIEGLNCTVTLLGSGQQAEQLDRLAQDAGGGTRIRNLGGQTSWSDIPDLLRAADLVICNNSGIAHLAAASGVLTLAIYSASHQPQEWGPRGRRSHALMAIVPCSPCGLDRLEACPNEHRCMRSLVPETVFGEACRLLSVSRGAAVAAMAPPVAQIDTAP